MHSQPKSIMNPSHVEEIIGILWLLVAFNKDTPPFIAGVAMALAGVAFLGSLLYSFGVIPV